MSVAQYDDILGIIHELLPHDSKLPNVFYQSRKLLEGIGMPYIKIDVFYNNCMLFYKDNRNKINVIFVVLIGMRKEELRLHAKFCASSQSQIGCKSYICMRRHPS
jgi:hypothetical protein